MVKESIISKLASASRARRRRKPPVKPADKSGGQWVFVEDKDLTDEQKARNLANDMDMCVQELSVFAGATNTTDATNPFALLDEFHDYFPGNNEVPEEGDWIMVKDPPNTEYTVPPLSVWFAEPWRMTCTRRDPHRVKIVTPKGSLGLFPHEYVRVKDPGKYWEFIGQGMSVHFFGAEDGIPPDKLFYLRSRGIAKRDAITMLIGEIRVPGVLWLETDRIYAEQLGFRYPDASRLATIVELDPLPGDQPVTPDGI